MKRITKRGGLGEWGQRKSQENAVKDAEATIRQPKRTKQEKNNQLTDKRQVFEKRRKKKRPNRA